MREIDYNSEHGEHMNKKHLEQDVADLDLSVRTTELLTRLDIHTLGALVRRTRQELLSAGAAPLSVHELEESLGDLGLGLARS